MSFHPRPLSEFLYDCDGNDSTDVLIDRLCNIVQVLIEVQPRVVQLAVLETLHVAPFPNPLQQELFA